MREIVDLASLFAKQFELSRVSRNEVVAILTEPRSGTSYSEAACIAARQREALAFEISVPGMGWSAPGITQGMAMGVPAISRPSPLLDTIRSALMEADFVVDLISETILHIPLREELLSAGKRILTIVEPPDALERLFPTIDIKERVLTARRGLEKARFLHVTSEAGTDLYYELIPGSGVAQYGFTDEAGHWDHWPSALISSYPVDGGVQGKLIVAPGDITLPFRHYVRDPITMRIENGQIIAIEGGVEARLMKDFIERWKEPALYSVSHMGMGLHPKGQWSALDFYGPGDGIAMDPRSMEGGFIFSTGPNRYVERWSEVHFDICMRGMSLELEGEVVMDEGVVAESLVGVGDSG